MVVMVGGTNSLSKQNFSVGQPEGIFIRSNSPVLKTFELCQFFAEYCPHLPMFRCPSLLSHRSTLLRYCPIYSSGYTYYSKHANLAEVHITNACLVNTAAQQTFVLILGVFIPNFHCHLVQKL